MTYFTKDAKTRLVTDASPVGLGAILEKQCNNQTARTGQSTMPAVGLVMRRQDTPNLKRRPWQFDGPVRSFTSSCTELTSRYLHIIKPLITALSAKSTPPSARIERWLLYLQQFRYVVKYIAGVDNHADVLSRLPLDPPARAKTLPKLQNMHGALLLKRHQRQPMYDLFLDCLFCKKTKTIPVSCDRPSGS